MIYIIEFMLYFDCYVVNKLDVIFCFLGIIEAQWRLIWNTIYISLKLSIYNSVHILLHMWHVTYLGCSSVLILFKELQICFVFQHLNMMANSWIRTFILYTHVVL